MSNEAMGAARALFAAINTGDLSRLGDLVTDDFVDHGSPFPIPPGPEGFRRILTWVSGTLRLRYEIEDVIETDDRIVVRATGRGIGVPEVHGPIAAGKPFAMTTVHVYRTEGDRLAEHWGVRDELGAMVQMGAVPAPDPAALA
ncbi:ester cyclase [Tsukamurella sp. 1534]|uniref:ester cyclase n=1 Tax=Tsukamurella sp. 1534 TaxID=1151061 RepID=UPI0002F59358|nr:ester cyclase [Tsukamurella sp. 1534]